MIDLNIFNICGFQGSWSIHAAACHRGNTLLFSVQGGVKVSFTVGGGNFLLFHKK